MRVSSALRMLGGIRGTGSSPWVLTIACRGRLSNASGHSYPRAATNFVIVPRPRQFATVIDRVVSRYDCHGERRIRQTVNMKKFQRFFFLLETDDKAILRTRM